MRNLGTQRTLVLGQRAHGHQHVRLDISTLPVSAVERIEVLKDGASAIYGSDAAGGVVNIITRSNVTDCTANVVITRAWGDVRFDVVAGWSNDRVSLTLSAEHAEEKAWARDRGFSKYGDRSIAIRTTAATGPISQYGQFTGLRPGLYRHCGLRLFPQPRRGSHQPGQLPPHR